MCVSTRDRDQFPSVLLHPPPLARELSESYGEMSRRSGVAAEEDSDLRAEEGTNGRLDLCQTS